MALQSHESTSASGFSFFVVIRSDLVPVSRYALMPGAAHITTWDAREGMNRAVRSFLRSADSTVER